MVKYLSFQLLLVIVLIACTTAPAGAPLPTPPAAWQDIPIMPGALPNSQLSGTTSYHYTVDADMKTVERFYLDTLKTSEWELLGKGDMSGSDFKSLVIWYSKGQSLRTIEIWIQAGRTHVAIVQER